MRRLALIPLALAAASCASVPVQPTAEDQAVLAEELRGRTADDPVSCVSQTSLGGGNRSVGEGVILFEGRSGRLYVNRPRGGCPVLGRDRALVTQSTSSQLCRGDIARVVDLFSNIDYGSCVLGEFTPYSRRAD